MYVKYNVPLYRMDTKNWQILRAYTKLLQRIPNFESEPIVAYFDQSIRSHTKYLYNIPIY